MFIKRLFSLKYFSAVGLVLLPVILCGQELIVPYNKYPFLEKDYNVIYRKDDATLKKVFAQFDTLIRKGDREVHILQIGDSHIQADYFPHSVRMKMQEMVLLSNGGRGFVFPYSIAKTNNPYNYKTRYTGEWKYCRHIQKNTDCEFGLSGVTVSTTDSFATVFINPNHKNQKGVYRFDRVKLFHKKDEKSFDVIFDGELEFQVRHDSFYTEFIFPEEKDSLLICLKKNDPTQERMEIFGITLENDDPGLVYSSVGVNGAKVEDYLRCSLLGPQVAVLDPALIVISLGTNDAYYKQFDEKSFAANYIELISRIREAAPESSIILTTPGDGYRYKKYYNYNYVRARKVIFEVARETDVGVWDFYSVMGGPNSIYEWYKNGLAQHDKLHLTQSGYELQGKLFYEALLRSYYFYLGN